MAKQENVKGWFTMNGVHIPIMEGQTKAEAAKTFINSKQGKTVASKKRQYIKKGKTVAERKILDAVQTSSSKYNLSNIKIVIDPRGDLNIRTKSGNRDIVTLRRSYFKDSDIDDLRYMGYIKSR